MDYEDAIGKLKDVFFAELSTQIDLMNAKRTDTVLAKMQAVYEESLDDKAKSYNYFGFIGTADAKVVVNGPATACSYVVEICLFIPDIQDKLIKKKLYRYNYCILEAVKKSWPKLKIGSPVELALLTPLNASLNNSSTRYKLLGVHVNFTMFSN